MHSVSYEKKNYVRGVHFTTQQSIGEDGSGQTTVLRISFHELETCLFTRLSVRFRFVARFVPTITHYRDSRYSPLQHDITHASTYTRFYMVEKPITSVIPGGHTAEQYRPKNNIIPHVRRR